MARECSQASRIGKRSMDDERLFLLTLPIHRAFCIAGTFVCVGSTFFAPSFWYIGLLVSLFFVLILVSRLRVVGLDDQQRALTLFGRGWLLATLAGCSSFVTGNILFQFCSSVPAAAVSTLAALTGLVPVYVRCQSRSTPEPLATVLHDRC